MQPRRQTRVLLVEDALELAESVVRHLTAQGFDVTHAPTIAAARNQIWESPPDLMLLDVMLPDGSGLDLCRELRGSMALPVIYLTALGHDSAVVQGLATGADDYIAKPFSIGVLVARINAVLRRSAAGRAGRLDLPPLRIDLTSGQVWLDQERIDLTKRELHLLMYFVANVGQGSTQEELLGAVWGDHSGVPTNTVRQHVSRLRRKLHLDQASPFELTLGPDRRYVFKQVRFGARSAG
ncbi:MAG: response regulator transcription factor [Bifidobacteriaceae bacterium]|jgi:DNA-binding response OmpR family regulator|nr:response regulator transcription factor [Bifidobacteriaceae bacterium]